MGKVPDCHFPLDVNVSQERAFVVDAEGKDAMLIGKFECSTEHGAVYGVRDGLEVQAMKRGEHGEFKLESVCRWDVQWYEVVV